MATKKNKADEPEAQATEVEPEPATPPAPEPEVSAGPQAAPLEPPEVKESPADPLGSSTNPVAAAAAVRTMPGDRHDQLVVEKEPGVFEAADPDDLWRDESPSFTFLFAKYRIHEQFFHPGASHPDRRLLHPLDAQVPRAQAGDLTQKVKEQLEHKAKAGASKG